MSRVLLYHGLNHDKNIEIYISSDYEYFIVDLFLYHIKDDKKAYLDSLYFDIDKSLKKIIAEIKQYKID